MFSGLPWLLLLWFPIQFSFQIDVKCSVGYLGSFSNDFLFQFLCKTDAKCSLGCSGSFCNRFLFSSYPKLMQNVLWAALVPPSCHGILFGNLYARQLASSRWSATAAVRVRCERGVLTSSIAKARGSPYSHRTKSPGSARSHAATE